MNSAVPDQPRREAEASLLSRSWRVRHPVHQWLRRDEVARHARNWLYVGLALMALSPIVAHFADAAAKNYFEHNPWRNWAKHITGVGEASTYLTLSFGLWVIAQGLMPKWQRDRAEAWRRIGRIAGFYLAGFLLSGLYVQLAKFTIGRRRPIDPGIDRVFEFSPLNVHWDFHSFPSGHSQVLMTFAALTSLLFPRFALALGVLATAAATTRVMVLQHYPSDVMAGLGVGIMGALSLRCIWVWRAKAAVAPSPSEHGAGQ